MKKIGGKNIASVGFPTIMNYLASNLTAVGLSIIIKIDEKLDAILFKKSCISTKKTKKNEITFDYIVIVH